MASKALTDSLNRSNRFFQSAIGGNCDAIEQLLETIAERVHVQFASQIGSDLQSVLTVEDLLQETFADVFLCIDDFSGNTENEFFGWVSKIARNNLTDAIRHHRASKRNPQRVTTLSEDESISDLLMSISQGKDPARAASRSEGIQRLRSAIGGLPHAYRVVIEGHDLKQIPIADLAKSLECSPGSLYMRRTRALTLLQKIMGSSVEI